MNTLKNPDQVFTTREDVSGLFSDTVKRAWSGAFNMEEWRNIKDYEGLYQVSSQGRIRKILKDGKYRILKQSFDKYGYLQLMLSKSGKGKLFRVHRLVACSFIPNTGDKETVNHKDANKTNNIADNLEWCSIGENIRHYWSIRHVRGTPPNRCKLNMNEVAHIREMHGSISVKELAKKFNVSLVTIYNIINRVTWHYV